MAELSYESQLAFKQPNGGSNMIMLTPHDNTLAAIIASNATSPSVLAVSDAETLWDPEREHSSTDASELSAGDQYFACADENADSSSKRQRSESMSSVSVFACARTPAKQPSSRKVKVQGTKEEQIDEHKPGSKRALRREKQMHGVNLFFAKHALILGMSGDVTAKGQALIRNYVSHSAKCRSAKTLASAALYLTLIEFQEYLPSCMSQVSHEEVAAFAGVSKSVTQRCSQAMQHAAQLYM
jgi:hypothetical protein